MKIISILIAVYLLATTAGAQLYAAEVRVCNKSDLELNNLQVNYRNYRKLNIGECSEYYKDPLAQEYVTVGLNLDGKHLGFRPKSTSFLLGEGKYSYNVSIKAGRLDLETHKD